ncbi:hypothetical protein [Kitasatospora sp. NPDC054795]
MPDRTTTALKRLERAKQDVARAMARDFREGASANEIARRARSAYSRPVVLEMIKAELAAQEAREALSAAQTAISLASHVGVENTGRFAIVGMPRVAQKGRRIGDMLTLQAVRTITEAGLCLRPLADHPADTDPAFILRHGGAVEVYKPSL